jgi:hypothetical protein
VLPNHLSYSLFGFRVRQVVLAGGFSIIVAQYLGVRVANARKKYDVKVRNAPPPARKERELTRFFRLNLASHHV